MQNAVPCNLIFQISDQTRGLHNGGPLDIPPFRIRHDRLPENKDAGNTESQLSDNPLYRGPDLFTRQKA